MIVKFKKLDEVATIPRYAKIGDAGMDLVAISCVWDKEFKQYIYGTGLAVEIPEGYVGLIFPRSSIYKYDLILSNHVGVIDSGYRGEIKFYFRNSNEFYKNNYQVGDRIGQIIIIPYPQIEPVEVDELSETERGSGGFGSTGK